MSGTTGLAQDPTEYRRRLEGQPDEQIDAWATELLRDMSIQFGVRRVISDLLRAGHITEAEFERVFAAGGGAPATLGRTADGELMVPAIELWCLVPGIRRETSDGRTRIIEYLVENFHEFVYI
jgi:hypothetical protein